MSSRDFHEVKRELAAEIRGEVLRGRGQLPRDKSGRVPPAFFDDAGTPTNAELPQDRAPRGFTSIGDLLAGVGPQLDAIAAQFAPLASRVQQLERLERELEALLSQSAPRLWAQIRKPLWKLLRQARRELRAVDTSRPLV